MVDLAKELLYALKNDDDYSKEDKEMFKENEEIIKEWEEIFKEEEKFDFKPNKEDYEGIPVEKHYFKLPTTEVLNITLQNIRFKLNEEPEMPEENFDYQKPPIEDEFATEEILNNLEDIYAESG